MQKSKGGNAGKAERVKMMPGRENKAECSMSGREVKLVPIFWRVRGFDQKSKCLISA